MGSICPKKIPPYEAKSVVELAERVVDKFIDDKKKVSGDARSSIETSCAEEFWKDYRMKVKKKESRRLLWTVISTRTLSSINQHFPIIAICSK